MAKYLYYVHFVDHEAVPEGVKYANTQIRTNVCWHIGERLSFPEHEEFKITRITHNVDWD